MFPVKIKAERIGEKIKSFDELWNIRNNKKSIVLVRYNQMTKNVKPIPHLCDIFPASVVCNWQMTRIASLIEEGKLYFYISKNSNKNNW